MLCPWILDWPEAKGRGGRCRPAAFRLALQPSALRLQALASISPQAGAGCCSCSCTATHEALPCLSGTAVKMEGLSSSAELPRRL